MPDEHPLHPKLLAALEAEDQAQLTEVLAGARAADIAESFDLLDDENRSHVLFALPPHTAAEVVIMLDEAVRGDVVDDLDTESLTEIVSALPPDDAADVLGELTEEEADEILDHMVDEQSDKIEELLVYDENTAGGIMTPDFVAVPVAATVADAVEHIRSANPDEELHEVYIVDADDKVVGTVPLRRLVTSPSATKLSGILEPHPVVVSVNDDQEAVVQIIRKYDVMEAAVVDADQRLVGRITHDDLLDVAEEEAAEDLYRMAGTDAAELETSSVFRAAYVRLKWLLPCMFGMLLSAFVLYWSKPNFDLRLFAALVLFVPMIGATGGNSGIQISTIIVRGFATGELASTKFLRASAREGRIALVMAPVCGVLALLAVLIFFPILKSLEPDVALFADSTRVAFAVGTAMMAAILSAALLGISLPFSFRKIGVDPAIASGPIVTTMNDVISVGIYMLLAMAIAT